MTTVVLTDKWTDRQAVRAVEGAWYDSDQAAWVFDPDASRQATLVAVRLFPKIREHLTEEQLAPLTEGQDTRPPNRAPRWAEGKDHAELLPHVAKDRLDRLYDFQAVDLGYLSARLMQDGGAYLGWDRGLGKTLGALTIAERVRANRVIIVTPNSSKGTVWTPEIAKWYGDRYDGRVFNVNGPKSKRDRALASFVNADGPAVLLVHYEALRLIEWAKVPVVDLVICDEAHRLANGSARGKSPMFYKALKRIRTKYKLALSGSIIVNSPEDFFGAQHWLFPKTYASRYRDWDNKYLHYVESGYGKVLIGVKPDKLEQMRDELSLFMCVRNKDDELEGLPERIVQDLYVDLTPTQQKVYDEMAERFIAELPDGERLIASNAVVQLTRLRQISAMVDDHSSKIDLAVDLVKDNLPHKTVVFTWHRDTATKTAERLRSMGITAESITGDTKMHVRDTIVKRFQEDDDPQVLVATIKTLGESVTLHRAADVIFLESSWTPADMDQAADRVRRIGQNRRVTITNIIAKGTVDETKVLPAVLDKAAIRKIVLGGTK